MKKINLFVGGVSLFAPAFAFAQSINTTFFVDTITKVKQLLNLIVPVIITLGIIFFLWSLVDFIRTKAGGGDANKISAARSQLIYSLVAMFIALSFIGIIRIVQGITGTEKKGNIESTDIPMVSF